VKPGQIVINTAGHRDPAQGIEGHLRFCSAIWRLFRAATLAAEQIILKQDGK
jgi:hypothetical protein